MLALMPRTSAAGAATARRHPGAARPGWRRAVADHILV